MSHNPNQHIYENNYSASQLELDARKGYDKSIIEFKLEILRNYCSEKSVLDLCCGGGAYLLELLPDVKSIVGLDFSRNLLKSLVHKLNERDERSKAKIVKADANNLPFEAEQNLDRVATSRKDLGFSGSVCKTISVVTLYWWERLANAM